MAERTLGDACVVFDCEHKTAPEAVRGTEYAYLIGTPHLRNGRIIFDQAKRVDQDTYRRWTARAVPVEGDLILAREAPVGEVGRIRAEQRVCLGQRTVLIRPKREVVDASYLHYLLLSPAMQDRMHSKSTGSTVAHLNVSDIKAMPLPPLPTLAKQRAIAAVLSALDDKIAINERIAGTSVDLAEARYSCTSRGMATIRLADAAKWYSGGTPRTSESSFWGGDIPWVSAASLKTPWIFESDRKITAEGAANGTRMVAAEAIIFVVRGMSLKSEFRIGMTQRKVAFGQDCKALVASPDIDPHVLFHAIRSQSNAILELVDEAGHGTGRLATDRIGSLEVAVAPTGSAIAEQLTAADRLAAARMSENSVLATFRDTLLPKLMSGDLRIRDAEQIVGDAT